MPPYLTPLQIFENYKKANPQKCKGKSTTEICRLAGLSDKQIAELKTTSAWLFCFDKENASTNDVFNMTKILGGNFSSKAQTKITEQVPSKQSNTQYHTIYTDLMLDKQGKIDMNQFSLKTIKQKYFEDKWIIEQEIIDKEDNIYSITVKNRKTGQNKYYIYHYADGTIEYNLFENNELHKSYSIKNGIVISLYNNNSDGSHIEYEFEDDGKTFKRIETMDSNGNYLEKIYDKNKLKKVNKYREIELPEVELLAKDVHNLLNKRNEQGKRKPDKKVTNEILSRINLYNIENFCDYYKDLSGWDFIDYVSVGPFGLDKESKNLIRSHIQKCWEQANGYEENKEITNSQVKNKHYTSSNVYDIKFKGNEIFIKNKTTGKDSYINMDKVFKASNIRKTLTLKETFQNLSGEILEIIANEGVAIKPMGRSEEIENKKLMENGIMQFGGDYKPWKEQIRTPADSTATLIHEIGHAVDNIHKFLGMGEQEYQSEAENSDFRTAFENGLKKYELAGYARHYFETSKNNTSKPCYYFSNNPAECWSRIFELLYNGTCEGEEVLVECFSECIDIEKKFIKQTQSMPIYNRKGL